jgi:hypothetical protein
VIDGAAIRIHDGRIGLSGIETPQRGETLRDGECQSEGSHLAAGHVS